MLNKNQKQQIVSVWRRCCLSPEYHQELKVGGKYYETFLGMASEKITKEHKAEADRYVVQYVDHWNGQPLIAGELIPSPGFFPGVSAFYPANKSTESPEKIRHRQLFDRFEMNCNTCRFLRRIPSPPVPRGWPSIGEEIELGLMRGICSKHHHPLLFCPKSPMDHNSDCWEGR